MNTKDNFLVNFYLKGFTSILIGIYFLLVAYSIKFMLDGFLIDNHIMGMMSTEIIEILIIILAGLFFLFSSLALFFRGKRDAKKFEYQLWNKKTKTSFCKYLILIILVFCILISLMNRGFINLIAPVFLTFYALLFLILKNEKRKDTLIIAAISVLLAAMCFLIPTYWYSSLSILGIAHITYGVAIKN